MAPVPKITPIAVPGQLYAAAAIVPTVSLAASEVTRIFSPRASSCACSSATTSAPIASAAAKPLFHATSVPASMAVCAAGKGEADVAGRLAAALGRDKGGDTVGEKAKELCAAATLCRVGHLELALPDRPDPAAALKPQL